MAKHKKEHEGMAEAHHKEGLMHKGAKKDGLMHKKAHHGKMSHHEKSAKKY